MRIPILIAATLVLTSATAQAALPDDVRAEIDALVEERMAGADIPGLSLVVVQGDEVTYAQGYGFADLEEAVPMTACTPVGPGSTLKSLTALAVMQLVEAGDLDLDAPVARYLPWFAVDGRPDDRITVRHALTMTSGLQDWMDTAMDASDVAASGEVGTPHTVDALEARVGKMNSLVPSAAPGEAWAYSSTGYTVAGLLIETITGTTYESYMQERVFGPLGMSDTTFGPAAPGTAQGYLRSEDGLRPEGPLQAAGYRPAGLDVFTSACDFGNYLAALLRGGSRDGERIVGSPSIEAMWTPAAAIRDGIDYGMGWYVQDWNGVKVVDHGGHAMVSGSAMFVAPEERVAVAVFANVDDLRVDAIGRALFERLTGASAVVRKGGGDFVPDRSVWEAYLGTYETVYGTPLRIYVEGGELRGFIEGPGFGFTLEALGDTEFVARSDIPNVDNADARFTVADDGTVHLTMAGQEIGLKAP